MPKLMLCVEPFVDGALPVNLWADALFPLYERELCWLLETGFGHVGHGIARPLSESIVPVLTTSHILEPGSAEWDAAAAILFPDLLSVSGSAGATLAELTEAPLSPCFAWLKVLAARRAATTTASLTDFAVNLSLHTGDGRRRLRGAPILACNGWLQSLLERGPVALTRNQIREEWLHRHVLERGTHRTTRTTASAAPSRSAMRASRAGCRRSAG